jgi:hypothetical protein
MKTKYERMNKEEKKKLIEKYKKTKEGASLLKRLNRLNIIGIIGIIFSILLIIISLKDFNILDYLTIIPLFLASILFIIMSYKLKKKVLNKFAIKGE